MKYYWSLVLLIYIGKINEAICVTCTVGLLAGLWWVGVILVQLFFHEYCNTSKCFLFQELG